MIISEKEKEILKTVITKLDDALCLVVDNETGMIKIVSYLIKLACDEAEKLLR